MGRREWCPCGCEQQVTQATLKKHVEEAARQRNIAMMGADPTPPAATLKVSPITGNNIFGSRAQASAPTFTPPIIDESTSYPDISMASPPPVTPFLPQHSIDDNDFPPDPIEHAHDPPQVSDPPSYYPSMEMSDADADEDEDETEDKDEARGEGKPDFEMLLDSEYLEQGNYRLLCRTC